MRTSSRLHTQRPFTRFLLSVFAITAIVAAGVHPALAQTTNFIEISKPDSSSYPELSLRFRMMDDTGDFNRNLDIESVKIIEDGQLIIPDRLDLLEPGMSLIVAVNEGPPLANRYAQVSRIDKVKNALIDWAKTKTITSMDDFSLVANSGIVASGLNKPTEWVDVLTKYQPDMKQSKQGLSSLSAAVDLAATTQTGNFKTPAILYVTPLPTKDEAAGLTDIISRAKLGNVRLYIFLAGPQSYATDPLAEPLIQAADETGGQFVVFTGQEDLPDLGNYFNPLTYVYKAVYHTTIKSSGNFPVVVRVTHGQTVIESDPIIFTLNVIQPNAIFVSPPAKVERTWTETKKRKDSVLTPGSVPLEIMIEFPDGMKRDLVYSRLFVDNRMVAENTTAPFENFKWDISKITETGSHVISASIEDSAGFIVQTVELTVDVEVQPKAQTWIEKLLSIFTAPTIALFVVIAAAGVLLVLLALRALRNNRNLKNAKTHRLEDPLTQPVMIENEILQPNSVAAAKDQWPHIPGIGLALARLVLQSTPTGQAGFPVEIPLGEGNTTIGSEAKKAKVILATSMISPLHARISRIDGDQFKLFDEGSGSGTWLNYAPVSQYGARLEHGDLVQFGAIIYRFEIYQSSPRKLRVESIKEE
jgi:pSer/pThr/pTyr-binding forkhead associated (FHA) protein